MHPALRHVIISRPVYSADLTSTAFAIGSATVSNPITTSFDNSNTVGWVSSESGAAVNGASWIGQDFGAANDKHIRRMTWRQGSNATAFDQTADACVTSLLSQYSDNGSAWTTVGTHTVPKTDTTETLDMAATGAHRYWRLLANSGVTAGFRFTPTEVEMMTFD